MISFLQSIHTQQANPYAHEFSNYIQWWQHLLQRIEDCKLCMVQCSPFLIPFPFLSLENDGIPCNYRPNGRARIYNWVFDAALQQSLIVWTLMIHIHKHISKHQRHRCYKQWPFHLAHAIPRMPFAVSLICWVLSGSLNWKKKPWKSEVIRRAIKPDMTSKCIYHMKMAPFEFTFTCKSTQPMCGVNVEQTGRQYEGRGQQDRQKWVKWEHKCKWHILKL